MTQQNATAIEEPQIGEPQIGGESSSVAIRIIGAIILLVILVAVGIFPRIARHREALAAVNESATIHPIVTLAHAVKGEPSSELLLPGNIQPLYSANLFARTDGYIERRNVDIGSKVKTGEVLAIISSPEIDQQLLQARATVVQSEASLLQARAALEQAKANAELARLTKERDLPLGNEHAISQQIVDSAVQANDARIADVAAAQANITAAEANVTANQANVARLVQMQSFERIVAPFDGVITARNVERGDLVSTGNAAKPLFSMAQSGTLRIQIDVPQSEAVNIQDGQKAEIDVKERLGRAYTGTVTRSAGSLDSAARTMLTEVQIDNRDGSLLPGMYAQVKFTLPQQRASLIIPTSSLVVDRAGMHVVTVNKDHTVHFNPVVVGKDMGTTIEIRSGLNGSESIVASPSDLLSEGEHVEVR
ncbi:putative Co/Zn/Cd efflux system membrane fusion protein [Acidisarcina polymorpha]|uniref:Putative Co/Zn/Cd efflux system membrane fusion protein n=1 Tax=Acidisarcina polymorpha TaxID=2211140 RepID=A0A2Z5G1C3_9BACT|nr:efflux RND transporter periplasmic adaptor subunit [Acidisarcina polymorpha]AXC12604.1 putative Co/Zn/Cd efflux system membrane fusion protein [Acidisarcina polymorpha]